MPLDIFLEEEELYHRERSESAKRRNRTRSPRSTFGSARRQCSARHLACSPSNSPWSPDGWTQHWSEEHNCGYFWHQQHGIAQWHLTTPGPRSRTLTPTIRPADWSDRRVFHWQSTADPPITPITPITPIGGWPEPPEPLAVHADPPNRITPITPFTPIRRSHWQFTAEPPEAPPEALPESLAVHAEPPEPLNFNAIHAEPPEAQAEAQPEATPEPPEPPKLAIHAEPPESEALPEPVRSAEPQPLSQPEAAPGPPWWDVWDTAELLSQAEPEAPPELPVTVPDHLAESEIHLQSTAEPPEPLAAGNHHDGVAQARAPAQVPANLIHWQTVNEWHWSEPVQWHCSQEVHAVEAPERRTRKMKPVRRARNDLIIRELETKQRTEREGDLIMRELEVKRTEKEGDLIMRELEMKRNEREGDSIMRELAARHASEQPSRKPWTSGRVSKFLMQSSGNVWARRPLHSIG